MPEKEDRIKRTPDKPKDKGEPIESIKDKDYGKPISDTARKTVIDKMTALFKKHPDKKDALIDKFKKQYGITTKQLSHADIRTAEQGQFLTIAINEIDSTL